jgi:hypothetical protein
VAAANVGPEVIVSPSPVGAGDDETVTVAVWLTLPPVPEQLNV